MSNGQFGYQFLPATKGDLAALSALETLAFSSDRLSPQQMRYHLSNAHALFLTCHHPHDGPVGYALFLQRKNRSARFYSLVIHPNHRGKGLAHTLIEMGLAALQEAGCTAVSLEVDCQNKTAIALYESFGFQRGNMLSNYYEDGRSAYKMRKDMVTPS